LNAEADLGDRVLFSNWFGYWLRSDLTQCMANENDKEILNSFLKEISLKIYMGKN
jgi:hypothetical protein